jgi:hypothetical protein
MTFVKCLNHTSAERTLGSPPEICNAAQTNAIDEVYLPTILGIFDLELAQEMGEKKAEIYLSAKKTEASICCGLILGVVGTNPRESL